MKVFKEYVVPYISLSFNWMSSYCVLKVILNTTRKTLTNFFLIINHRYIRIWWYIWQIWYIRNLLIIIVQKQYIIEQQKTFIEIWLDHINDFKKSVFRLNLICFQLFQCTNFDIQCVSFFRINFNKLIKYFLDIVFRTFLQLSRVTHML